MNCRDLRPHLGLYVDRELDVGRSLDVQEHLAFCMECQWALAKERELRQLLKTRLAGEVAPPELHRRIRSLLRAEDRRTARTRVARVFRRATLPVAALLLVGLIWGLRDVRAPVAPPAVDELVARHVVYSRVGNPAEIASGDQGTVAGWLRGRVSFDVLVPDFSPAGIALVGARLVSLSDREVAYLLYEKERQRVSLFAFARRGLVFPTDGWIEVGDSRFYAATVKGLEVVLWSQGDLAYALVSPLSREALLECALTVWRLVPPPMRSGA